MSRGFITFADRLITQGVKFPVDTVIFEATEVLRWVEERLEGEQFAEIATIFDDKRTMPVYPHCFVEASVNTVEAGMYLCEMPLETVRSRSNKKRFVGLDFGDMKFDEVRKVVSREPTVQEAVEMDQMLESAFKFFLLLPFTDYGYGLEVANAAMGAIFDGYGLMSSIVMDSSMGDYVDEVYGQLGVKVNRNATVLAPICAVYGTGGHESRPSQGRSGTDYPSPPYREAAPA